MFKALISSVLLVSSLSLVGCASVPMASPQADMAAKEFKTDPAKSNIYIYRDETFGAAVKMLVLLDGGSPKSTAAETYILHQVNPGSHVITSDAENNVTLSLNTEAGKNYFVWQEVKMGVFSARSKLHLVDEAKGRAGVLQCKLVK